MSTNTVSPSVAESTPYDNLIASVADYRQGFQPEKPEATPDFPFELKVHIWRAGEAEQFARTIGRKLSSDRKKFVFRAGGRTKPQNATFVETRANPIAKKTTHLTREEAKLSKGRANVAAKYANPADASQTWTGRGRKPKWVVELLASGKSLDDAAI